MKKKSRKKNNDLEKLVFIGCCGLGLGAAVGIGVLTAPLWVPAAKVKAVQASGAFLISAVI